MCVYVYVNFSRHRRFSLSGRLERFLEQLMRFYSVANLEAFGELLDESELG